MENMLTTVGRTEIAFKNKQLQNATMHIFNLGENIRQKWFEIGAIMASVDTLECYKEDGFSSVHEWANKVFNLKKSRTYDLLKIGREYTREILSKNGRTIGYECNLLPESAPDNFNVTQVTRLLPLGREEAARLVETEEVTPNMTVKAIADVVKAHLHPDGEEAAETSEEAETDSPADSKSDKLRDILDNISTMDLIIELARRGFMVADGRTGEWVKTGAVEMKGGEN